MIAKFVALSLSVLVVHGQARAECDSVDSCTQALKCQGSYKLGNGMVPNSFYCSDKVEAETVDPICEQGFRNNNDWKFDASKRQCTRTRENGDVVFTAENLECPSGSSSAMPGNMPATVCKKPERTEWRAPSLTAPNGSAGLGRPADSQAESTRLMICPVGAVKKTGPNYFCELYLASDRKVDPECKKGFDWDAGKKKCTKKNNGATVESDDHTCDNGATYNAGQGKCVTPKGTYYASPKLVSIN